MGRYYSYEKIGFLACFLWNCLTLFWIFSRSGQSLIWIPSLNKTFVFLELQSLSLWWINFLSLWKGRNLFPNLHILLKLILAKNVFYSAMILLVCCGVRTFRNTHRILNRFPAVSKIDSATELMLSTPGRKYANPLPTLILLKNQQSNHLKLGAYSIEYPRRTLLSWAACSSRSCNVYLVMFGQKHKSRSQPWILFSSICFDTIQNKMTGQVNG